MDNSIRPFVRQMSQYHGLNGQAAAGQNGGGGFFNGLLGGSLSQATPIILNAAGGATPRHTIIATDSASIKELRKGEKDDQAENRAEKAAWIGAIVALVFAGLNACTLKDYYNDLEKLKDAQEFKKNVIPTLTGQEQVKWALVIDKHIEVVEARSIRSRNVAIITALVLGCGVAAFLGGMFAVAWLVTVAIVIGVMSAALGIFMTVWHWNDQVNLPNEMQNQVRQLVGDFQPGEV